MQKQTSDFTVYVGHEIHFSHKQCYQTGPKCHDRWLVLPVSLGSRQIFLCIVHSCNKNSPARAFGCTLASSFWMETKDSKVPLAVVAWKRVVWALFLQELTHRSVIMRLRRWISVFAPVKKCLPAEYYFVKMEVYSFLPVQILPFLSALIISSPCCNLSMHSWIVMYSAEVI